MIQAIEKACDTLGYIPIVGSCVGGGRLGLGFAVGIISAIGLAIGEARHDDDMTEASLRMMHFGMSQARQGFIECIPFAKIICFLQRENGSSGLLESRTE